MRIGLERGSLGRARAHRNSSEIRATARAALGGMPGAVRLGQRGSARDLERTARDLKRIETIRRFHHEARSLVSESPQ